MNSTQNIDHAHAKTLQNMQSNATIQLRHLTLLIVFI